MANKGSYTKTMNPVPVRCRLGAFALAALLPLLTTTSRADGDHSRNGNTYRQVNLVSDLPGVALLQDTNLVNAWGMSFNANSPFWISDNGRGLSTLYAVTNDAGGAEIVSKLGLEVRIGGGVTGQAANTSTNFHGDAFLFVSENGTVSGWRGALGTQAEVLTNRPTAVYKGATLVSTSNGLLLLAANFSEGTVDVYNGSMTLVGQFSDPNAPANYAPFNVQLVDGLVFVTFAKQDETKHDDVPGPGHGLINVLDPETGAYHRFVTGTDAGGDLHQIDSPWGVALAPDSFGKHGGDLLVGNFGNGTIMSFGPDGEFRGLLRNVHHRPIRIDGLWGLSFGSGGRAGTPDTLFFTAGPLDESHGLFGSLRPAAGHR